MLKSQYSDTLRRCFMPKSDSTPIRTMLRQYIALAYKGVTQNGIAKEIGVTDSTLCRFLAGKSMDEAGTLKLINWMFGHA